MHHPPFFFFISDKAQTRVRQWRGARGVGVSLKRQHVNKKNPPNYPSFEEEEDANVKNSLNLELVNIEKTLRLKIYS